MANAVLVSHNPIAQIAWYDVDDGLSKVRRPEMGIPTAEAAEEKRLALLAEAQAQEAAREARRQERQRQIDAESVARAIAKATATPHFLGSLTFLKLVQFKDTVPYFDEIKAEMDRLQAEADAAERGEEG